MSDTAPPVSLPPVAPRTPHIYIAGLGLQMESVARWHARSWQSRCVAVGAILVEGAELVSGSAEAGWYRLPGKNLVPWGLLLDGPNPYLGGYP